MTLALLLGEKLARRKGRNTKQQTERRFFNMRRNEKMFLIRIKMFCGLIASTKLAKLSTTLQQYQNEKEAFL